MATYTHLKDKSGKEASRKSRSILAASTKSAHGQPLTAIKLAMVISGAVLVLMMTFGLLMRAAQANILPLEPNLFYQILTAHGIGMVGTAALTSAAIMWYFLGRYVTLTPFVFWALLGFFLSGVAFILGAIFIGGFAGAWTFLYPLPANSGGAWGTNAAAAYLIGLLLVGTGLLLYLIECGRAIAVRYGGLGRALGWPLLFSGKQDDAPPPTVLAAAAAVVYNGMGVVVGAAVLAISLVNLYMPAFTIDPLLAKNLIYFFGHVIINASMYMASVAVYEIIPEYTGKPWKTSRVLVASWNALVFMLMAVYPHHLYQDIAMPAWAMVMAQIVSYANGLPLLGVTAFSLLAYMHRSGMRWDLPAALLVAGVAGWALGSIPAIIDGLISVNNVMHNTQWVPGHFHTYLLMGEIAVSLGFFAWLYRREGLGRQEDTELSGAAGWGFAGYVAGGFAFTLVFLTSGAMSVPRRWAVHLPEWWAQDRLGTVFAFITIAGVLAMFVPLARRLVASMRV